MVSGGKLRIWMDTLPKSAMIQREQVLYLFENENVQELKQY